MARAGYKPFATYARSDFDALVLTLEPELRRFVARKVGTESVDDVLQEVWIAAWLARDAFDRRSKPRTWIYGICLHKCHDQYRRQRTEGRLVPLDEIELRDPSPCLENAVLNSAAVDHLLGQLSEAPREVLELYYYAQLTLTEIATVLHRNPNTVKYQFYRAHTTLLALAEGEIA